MTKHKTTQTTPHDSTGTLITDAEDVGEIPSGLPSTQARNRGWVSYDRRFVTNISLYLSEMVQDMGIVTIIIFFSIILLQELIPI